MDSLSIYALTRQPQCDGETWGCVLLDTPATQQFASDAGTGLQAGGKAAGIAVHQLDWEHLLRPLWGQAIRLEQQAYTALGKVEERACKFDQAGTPGRLAQHLTAWEGLSAESLRHLGKQWQAWGGRVYAKLSANLINWAENLFGYQPVLVRTLAPLITQWGARAIQALSRLWQIEADAKRHSVAVPEQQARQMLWEKSLDEAHALLGPQQLWQAWEALCQVLGRSWRGSMLAECINRLLRPALAARKHTDQGCLELFRFLHNVHPFERGKRAGHSPAQLVGLPVPEDTLTLLGLAPKPSSTTDGQPPEATDSLLTPIGIVLPASLVLPSVEKCQSNLLEI
jgi:hypothetical protein